MKHSRNPKRIALLLASTAASLFAQEADTASAPPEKLPELTVTATRTETLPSKLGQDLLILTSEDLKNARYQTVIEALRDLPGLDIKSYGPCDSNAMLTIRGMETYQGKVLIDGIPYMDNSSTQSLPMLGNISLAEIDRIEILRGATSLQGSSAMAGVINIITRRATEDGLHAAYSLEAGSHARFNNNLAFYGKEGPANFRIAIGRNRERGISAVATDLYGNVNADNEHYRDMSYAGKLGIQFTDNWRAEFNGSFQDIDEEYDSGYTYADWTTGDTVVVPDEDNTWVRRAAGSARVLGKDLFGGLLDTELRYSRIRSDRAYLNNGTTTYRYIGDTGDLSLQGTLHLNETNDLSLGISRETEQARNLSYHKTTLDEEHRSNAAFAGYQFEPVENLFLNLNGRYTHHSEFGGEWTGDTAAKYYLSSTGTTFRASAGKGYRSPSVYELFAPANGWGFKGGNPDLKPETNYSWEIGADQEFLDKSLTLGTAYFENKVHDFIASNSTTYYQIHGLSIRGVETSAQYKLDKSLSLRLAYTYQKVRDRESEEEVAYMPKHKVSFNANWSPLENRKLNFNLGGAWTGKRWNYLNADYKTRSRLDDFLLVHTAVSYQFTENLEAYARIENLLNTNYTLSDDYGTRYNTYGRCYYLGMTYTF